MIQFEIGKTYWTRSICDNECVFRITVQKRTAKTLTFRDHNETRRRKIETYNGIEFVMPLGRSSMSPAISADKVAPQ